MDVGSPLTAILTDGRRIEDRLTFGDIARANGDEVTWLLQSFLDRDNQRRNRWSAALARFAIGQRAATADAIAKWVGKWSPIADTAAQAIAALISEAPEKPADLESIGRDARRARISFLGKLLDGNGEVGA